MALLDVQVLASHVLLLCSKEHFVFFGFRTKRIGKKIRPC